MIRKLLVALGLFVAGSSYATEWTQLCYVDIDICMHYRTFAGDRFGEIIIKESDKALVTDEVKAEMKDIGFSVAVYPDDLYHQYAMKWPLGYRTLAESKADLQDPRTRNVIKSGASCAGGLLACAGSSYMALETAGGSLFMARLACVRAGGSCGFFILEFDEWRTFQKEIKAKAAADAKSLHPTSGGGEPTTFEPHQQLVPVGSPYHRRHGTVTLEDPRHPYNP